MRFKTSIAAACLASLLGTATAADVVDDATLTAKVKAALIANPDTQARQIDVESRSGTVQLNGFVDSTADRTAAERVAMNVSGVKRVENNLSVQGAPRSAGTVVDDGVLTARVKAALIGISVANAMDINVETRSGVVQLNGFVSTAEAKETAESAAVSVEGVRSVENNLTVKP
jgi:hyperosmotically inducible protein